MPRLVEHLTAEDIGAFSAARRNTCESNHPLGAPRGFMGLLLEGTRALVEEFRGSDDYKLKLGA